jgi:hypothetical protein
MPSHSKIVAYTLDRFFNLPMYVYEEIGSSVAFEKSWNLIVPPEPLQVRRRFQAISLQIDGAYHKGDREGLFLEDGGYIWPDIEIEDDDHLWHRLEGGTYGISRTDFENDVSFVSSARFNLRGQAKPPFHRVRLRSDTPFICKKVSWLNYNLK